MRRPLAAIAAFCFVSLAHAQDRIPIEDFFKLPQYQAMRISPDGKHIAATAPVGDRQNLVIIDLATRKATPVTALKDRDVVNPIWVNNRRLLYSTTRLGERDVDQRGGGIFAVDLDGTSPRLVSQGSDERNVAGAQVTFRRYGIVRFLPGETDDIIVEEEIYGGGIPQAGPLYRLNTRTGRTTMLSLGKPDSGQGEGWTVDNEGVPRLFSAFSADEHRRRYYRASADAPWKKLDEDREVGIGLWSPLAMAEDNKTVYVWSRKDRDKAAIFRFDPEKNQLTDLVAQHPQVDLTSLVTTKDGVAGVRYRADKAGVAWFDDTVARVQGMFDKSFANNVNQLSWTHDKRKFVVTSYSDVLPASFYLFDRETNKAEWLADARPWIKPDTQAPMQPVRYKARDGLEIPAYLTIPRGSSGKKLPMVVEVHGGPWVPGHTWQWNPEVQFLASRGYAVLQPNFRGTLGYGRKHFTSSFFQWGLAMQDDITDGVKWAIEQGIADPDRVCIYGGSYGGYATMMGVAKEPDLFKCGINYVGVTDLPLLMTASWSDTFNSEGAQTSFKRRLGDLDKDAVRLRDTSPVNLASRIKADILMAYGGADVRVVPEHGTRMRSALERAGKKPQWIIVDDEGHGFRKLENQVMFYGAMERFLEKNIGK